MSTILGVFPIFHVRLRESSGDTPDRGVVYSSRPHYLYLLLSEIYNAQDYLSNLHVLMRAIQLNSLQYKTRFRILLSWFLSESFLGKERNTLTLLVPRPSSSLLHTSLPLIQEPRLLQTVCWFCTFGKEPFHGCKPIERSVDRTSIEHWHVVDETTERLVCLFVYSFDLLVRWRVLLRIRERWVDFRFVSFLSRGIRRWFLLTVINIIRPFVHSWRSPASFR